MLSLTKLKVYYQFQFIHCADTSQHKYGIIHRNDFIVPLTYKPVPAGAS